MTEGSTIDYPGLVLGALRAAIASVLRQVAEQGLPGEHHFYITFRTAAPGVEMPPGLRNQHPDELTIVLQHQYWDFLVDDEGFSVVLRFSGAKTPLRVPFAAMTAFADPSVEFGVQLVIPEVVEEGPVAAPPPEGEDNGAQDKGTVIAFDRNRKKE